MPPKPRTLMYAALTAYFVSGLTPCVLAQSREGKEKNNAPHATYSTALTGQIGLNTVPSARMAPNGSAQIGISTNDPYIHGFMSFQIAQPLNITLRQTSESSSLLNKSRRLYPGLDFKLRLLQEREYLPAIAVGVQSAAGHKRMAGEYISASKRVHDFDFTAGVGWGRYGSAKHFANPLKTLSGHFGKDRSLSDEFASGPKDWFTGANVGLFAGIEYFTPIEGLSVKADWGADRYEAEKSALGYNRAAPWSASVNYKPSQFMDISIGTHGLEKVMARLSFQGHPRQWAGRTSNRKPPALSPAHTKTGEAQIKAHTNLKISPHTSLPLQIAHAVRQVINGNEHPIENVSVTPHHMGLRGPNITLSSRDFENATLNNHGSAAEIWRNASVTYKTNNENIDADNDEDEDEDKKKEDKPRPYNLTNNWNFRFILNNDMSLSEDDTGILHRSALHAKLDKTVMTIGGGTLTSGTQVSWNIKDNLHNLQNFRSRSPLPVRSDIDIFTDKTFALEREYLSYFKTLNPDFHLGLSAGLLEEMYAGAGGEILYRPHGKTYSIGAEAWQVFKRDPNASFNLGLTGDNLLTGHINAHYEFPQSDITASISAGRYLAQDIGGEIGLHKTFQNGTRLSAQLRATDTSDIDIFGSSTHLYSGLNFSVPIGNIPYIGEGSEIRVNAYPIGRDAAQRINKPLPIYDATTPLSYRHITQHWGEIVN